MPFYNAIFPTEFTLLWNLKIISLIDRRIAKLVLDLRLWKKKKIFFKKMRQVLHDNPNKYSISGAMHSIDVLGSQWSQEIDWICLNK